MSYYKPVFLDRQTEPLSLDCETNVGALRLETPENGDKDFLSTSCCFSFRFQFSLFTILFLLPLPLGVECSANPCYNACEQPTDTILLLAQATKSQQSTDIEVLEELAAIHPLPAKVAEYRQLAKLRGTYTDVLPEMIHPHTGRIHSSFNQVGTATGRLSSSHPNLQNIPVRTVDGREIRTAFVPGKGFDLLLSCDYSQIELRVLAHFSGDDRLCEAFHNNEDIHTRVASEVFDVTLAKVNADMRRIAKTVNFGVIYGQSAFGLSKQLGIDHKEAQQFIDDYFATYSSIRQYLDSVLDGCIEKGYVTTLFGRRRYFAPGTIRQERVGNLNTAERMAINTVIQGTAADLMKQAMVKLMPLDRFEANLLLQIHDELVFEVTQKDAERLMQYVVETMQLNQPLRVPLVVDAELAKYWK